MPSRPRRRKCKVRHVACSSGVSLERLILPHSHSAMATQRAVAPAPRRSATVSMFRSASESNTPGPFESLVLTNFLLLLERRT